MQTTLETLENYSNTRQASVSNVRAVLGRWLSELFGCQHTEMSRPFSRQGETFRVCITCGAHRQFDEKTWNTVGPYYFKEARRLDLMRH